MSAPSLATLRAWAVARSLFPPTDLQEALNRLGFVQADPIRAPARAQDLTLRHRVAGYRNGDLDRRYGELAIEEDVFVNYGFVTPAVHALLHPGARKAPRAARRHADALLAFVGRQGTVHPRDVDRHFAHGRVTNAWGGSSRFTTDLLDQLHYAGSLRIAGRERGVRLYALRPAAAAAAVPERADDRLDHLVDVAVRLYAPVPSATLAHLVNRFQYGTPQWRRRLPAALRRAKARLGHLRIDGVTWYWPDDEQPSPPIASEGERVRFLAPFDPVVWDRRRFEHFWGWAYRFEAYTPVARRKLGYYALPLLWRDRVIGWGNLSVADGTLVAQVGYVTGRRPRASRFAPALEDELARLRAFLDVTGTRRLPETAKGRR